MSYINGVPVLVGSSTKELWLLMTGALVGTTVTVTGSILLLSAGALVDITLEEMLVLLGATMMEEIKVLGVGARVLVSLGGGRGVCVPGGHGDGLFGPSHGCGI